MENMRMVFARHLMLKIHGSLNDLNKTESKLDRTALLNELINLSEQLKSAFEQQKNAEKDPLYPKARDLRQLFEED